jgi:hypothetical protein
LHSYATSLGRIRVWKIPATVEGMFHDDGTWEPVSGKTELVKTPKLKYLERSTVANIPSGQRKLPDGIVFGYLASGRGVGYFCGETESQARDRFRNFARSESPPTLWKIPAGVPCAVAADGTLVPDEGTAKIVRLKKRTAARVGDS